MSGALRAELRRISTTKLWWIALICIFGLSAGYAALPAAVALLQSRAGVASSPFTDPGIIRSIYNGGNVIRGLESTQRTQRSQRKSDPVQKTFVSSVSFVLSTRSY